MQAWSPSAHLCLICRSDKIGIQGLSAGAWGVKDNTIANTRRIHLSPHFCPIVLGFGVASRVATLPGHFQKSQCFHWWTQNAFFKLKKSNVVFL
jgi:hypothetical protein